MVVWRKRYKARLLFLGSIGVLLIVFKIPESRAKKQHIDNFNFYLNFKINKTVKQKYQKFGSKQSNHLSH